MCSIHTDSATVSYDAVREAMDGEPYKMSLTGRDAIQAVIDAVNQGIDSHLEACFCPELGDSYEGGARTAGKLTLCRTLECSVSIESFPVLLRRLFESGSDPASGLARDILTTLGFDEFGCLVGREALGLE